MRFQMRAAKNPTAISIRPLKNSRAAMIPIPIREFVISIASPEALSWGGFVVLASALVGEAGIFLIPQKLERLHREIGFALALLAAGAYAVERIGDDAVIGGLEKRATAAETAFQRLKSPRTLTAKRQLFVVSAVNQFAGQRYEVAISQGADDGPALWESLYAALTKAGWVYLPPGHRPSPLAGRLLAFL